MIVGASGGAGTLTSHNHTAAGGDGGELTDSLFDGYLQGLEVSAPLTPPANSLRVYVKDKAGVSALYAKNDAGTEYELGAAGGLVGHDLVGPDHTASGLTAGQVVRASGVTTFAWAQLAHADLGTVTANQHHNQAHAIDGADHTGSLTHAALASVTADQHHAQSHAHNGADSSGTVAHSALTGVTANQHHNQAHAIDGADHTASGLTAGHALRATGAAAFAFGQVQHGDLGGVTANQHHNQAHAIDGADHSGTLGHGALSGVTANQHHNQAHALWSTDHNDVDTGDTRNDGDVLTWVAGSSVWRASAPAGGAALTVKEVDGTPSVASVSTIRLPNGTLTDDGGGQVTYTAGAGAATQPGEINLPAGLWTPSDDTANNLAGGVAVVKGGSSDPRPFFWQNVLADNDIVACLAFMVPAEYGGSPAFDWLYKMVSATTGNVKIEVRVACYTPDTDTTDFDVKNFATVNSSADTAVPATTAGRIGKISVTLTNDDSMNAGDICIISVKRVAASSSNASGNMEHVGSRMRYTRTL